MRYDVGGAARSEWTHEQEWRLHTAGFQLPGIGVGPILLVDDPAWRPLVDGPVHTGNYITETGERTGYPTGTPEMAQQRWLPAPDLWPLPRIRVDRETGHLQVLPYVYD